MLTRKEMRRDKRAVLRERATVVLDHEFVARQIVPLVTPCAEENGNNVVAAPSDWQTEIVWARGTGRMTFRYDFNNGMTIYAKAYTDDLGTRSYRALQYLWENGYGREAERQVPEPLAFFPEENLLLMRRAAGVPIDRLIIEQSTEESITAARAAARWLAAFHQTEVPFAEQEPPCDIIKIFKLADGLAKAAAAFPEQASLLLDLLQKIRKLAPSSSTAMVPTHGQYTPANVFLDSERATVIDLDRIMLSDPAKDVALFVHRVKSYLLRASGDIPKAEHITSAFIDEYQQYAAVGNLINLPYYKALYLLKGFAKFAKDRAPGDPARQAAEDFYLSEFDRCVKENEMGVRVAEHAAEEAKSIWATS